MPQKFKKSGGGIRPFWKRSIIKLHFFFWEAPLRAPFSLLNCQFVRLAPWINFFWNQRSTTTPMKTTLNRLSLFLVPISFLIVPPYTVEYLKYYPVAPSVNMPQWFASLCIPPPAQVQNFKLSVLLLYDGPVLPAEERWPHPSSPYSPWPPVWDIN